MLWKYFQNCKYSFRENWEVNLRICHTVPRFNPYSCLQFHWNRKYFSSTVLRLRGRLFMVLWYGFHLRRKGKQDWFLDEGLLLALIGSFFFNICRNLSDAQNILPRQQIFYFGICFFISFIPLVLQHLRIFVYCNAI